MKIVLTQEQIVKIVSDYVGRHWEVFGLPKDYATTWTHVRTDRFGSGEDAKSEIVITIHTKEKP